MNLLFCHEECESTIHLYLYNIVQQSKQNAKINSVFAIKSEFKYIVSWYLYNFHCIYLKIFLGINWLFKPCSNATQYSLISERWDYFQIRLSSFKEWQFDLWYNIAIKNSEGVKPLLFSIYRLCISTVFYSVFFSYLFSLLIFLPSYVTFGFYFFSAIDKIISSFASMHRIHLHIIHIVLVWVDKWIDKWRQFHAHLLYSFQLYVSAIVMDKISIISISSPEMFLIDHPFMYVIVKIDRNSRNLNVITLFNGFIHS